jgi:hypothetical protein
MLGDVKWAEVWLGLKFIEDNLGKKLLKEKQIPLKQRQLNLCKIIEFKRDNEFLKKCNRKINLFPTETVASLISKSET